MTGTVLAHHLLLNVVLRILPQPDVRIEFVIDTGFVGHLTLPTAAITALNLRLLRRTPAKLADGSVVRVKVFALTILWHGAERDVEVLAMDSRPLLGMLLLDGSEMNVQFADGGLLQIDTL